MRLRSLLLILSLLPLGAADRFPVPATPADLAVPPAQATKTPSGLVSLVLEPGKGKAHPGPQDLVTVEFSIWTQDGKLLDSTAHQAVPLTRPMDRLLKGLGEGLQLMGEGEQRRLWLPEALGFAGAAGRPAGMLVLDVTLVAFEPSPFKAPEDVAGPSRDAVVLPSGLAMRVLREGKGVDHPQRTDLVRVHYSGWTTDGELFDSSWKRGQPASIRLNAVIKGWTEGVQLLVPGQKARFWIPEKLAYKGARDMPAGMLVFDIELLSFDK